MLNSYARTVLLFALALLLSGRVGAVCSDRRHPSVAEEFRASTEVVIGKVIASENYASSDDPEGIEGTRYTLGVLKSYKGNAGARLRVTSENTSSRFPFDQGATYLLFVSSYDGTNIVDPCGNSGLVDRKKRELDVIERGGL